MNSVTLIGRIATDFYPRETQSGLKTCSFRLAVPRPGKDKGADFVWIKTWNGTAEAVQQYRAKGDEVCIEGHISSNLLTKNDVKYDAIEINARRVHFLRTKGDAAAPTSDEPVLAETSTPAPEADEFVPEVAGDDDIPF